MNYIEGQLSLKKCSGKTYDGKENVSERKETDEKRKNHCCILLALFFAVSAPAQEVQAEEYNENTTLTVVVANKTPEYDPYGVQPLTTLFDCEIIMAFRADEGLCMTFTTSCAGSAKVIGVKDIKVQQKCGMDGKRCLLLKVRNPMIVQFWSRFGLS